MVFRDVSSMSVVCHLLPRVTDWSGKKVVNDIRYLREHPVKVMYSMFPKAVHD